MDAASGKDTRGRVQKLLEGGNNRIGVDDPGPTHEARHRLPPFHLLLPPPPRLGAGFPGRDPEEPRASSREKVQNSFLENRIIVDLQTFARGKETPASKCSKG